MNLFLCSIIGALTLCALAAQSDLKVRRIPNRLLGLFFIVGWLWRAIQGLLLLFGILESAPEFGLLNGLWGLLLPLILLPLWLLRLEGAGDIKLLCVVGLWLGVREVGHVIVFSYVSAGVVALVLLIRSGELKSRLQYFFFYLTHTLGKPYQSVESLRQEQPFAPFVLCGTLIASLLYFL